MLPLNPFSHNPILILLIKLIEGLMMLLYPLYSIIGLSFWMVQKIYLMYQYLIHFIIFYFIKSENFYLLKLRSKPFLIKIIKNPSLNLFKEAIKNDPKLYKFFENRISDEWRYEAVKSNYNVMDEATIFTIPMHLEYLECEKSKFSYYQWDKYLPEEYRVSNNPKDVIKFLKLRLESDDFSSFLNKN